MRLGEKYGYFHIFGNYNSFLSTRIAKNSQNSTFSDIFHFVWFLKLSDIKVLNVLGVLLKQWEIFWLKSSATLQS